MFDAYKLNGIKNMMMPEISLLRREKTMLYKKHSIILLLFIFVLASTSRGFHKVQKDYKLLRNLFKNIYV